MRPHVATEPRTVTSAPGLTARRRPWPEKAERRPANRAEANFDPLGNLAPDEGCDPSVYTHSAIAEARRTSRRRSQEATR
ncbi:hypothetical protein GA0070561_6004 [Micromonospora saelicesensis]|uniref:Uncharacterized protein n=1 Tax=Micromonospora saelicesensis TaxID=285676 RepID=A0A1C4ZYJ2_9ACTN|nr:hypothetical protein GA0070561_6004 [Micromonospora saelicesensis]